MGFTAPFCMVILFLAVATAETVTSTSIVNITPQNAPDQTTVNGELKTSESTVKADLADSKISKEEKLRKNDDNDFTPDGDGLVDEILSIEALLADDANVFNGGSKVNSEVNREDMKPGDVVTRGSNDPLNAGESVKLFGIRRQGDVNPSISQTKQDSSTESNDPNQGTTSNPPPRFGQRYRNRKPNDQDETPVLKLRQGGYDRPFKQRRFRNRYVSKPDSSEQSEKVAQEPVTNSDRQQSARQIVRQESYPPPRQPPYQAFGPGAVQNPTFEAPARNVLAINPNIPTTAQNGFLNTPPTGLTDFPTSPYQAQFPNYDAGLFPNFGRDPTNVGLYQVPQNIPFQDSRILSQAGPQGQAQPVFVDPSRNIAPQFQPNPFSTFTNFDSIEDNSRPNYASYFRNPTMNPQQFQVPPNFYGTSPSGPQSFNNPPINFLSNPLNQDERFGVPFLRYPVTTDAQIQRNVNDQQPDSDASQEEKKTNVNSPDTRPSNSNETPSVPFRNDFSGQNEDVFIRYPTNEAGYAVEENLPPRNSSDEANANRQPTTPDERNYPNVDPYRNALNTLRPNQRRNNTFIYPTQFFRDAPIDFGYQRPQNQIPVQHPDRNIGLSRFPSPDFRNPFDPALSPENNYLFLNPDNRRRSHQESDKTPACAKQNNASICFEDNDYPRSDILYSLNTNSFLADRLSGPDLPLDSATFVEQNTSRSDQTSTENYACEVNTKYGSPLRAKNLAGVWRIIVSLPGRFSQPVRLEVCKSLGDSCNYVDSQVKTTCVQKFSLQRLLTWSPDRGIYSDVYKFPVACSCQILEKVEA